GVEAAALGQGHIGDEVALVDDRLHAGFVEEHGVDTVVDDFLDLGQIDLGALDAIHPHIGGFPIAARGPVDQGFIVVVGNGRRIEDRGAGRAIGDIDTVAFGPELSLVGGVVLVGLGIDRLAVAIQHIGEVGITAFAQEDALLVGTFAQKRPAGVLEG